MSAAVMTRTHWIEGPYLNEFIAWYVYWGFTKIYFINTEPAKRQDLINYIAPELIDSVVIIDYSGNINEFPYARKLFESVVEDYILHVDTDEFLVLPNGYSSITEFISSNAYNLYTFHWVLVPVNKFVQPSMLDYLYEPGATCKPCDSRKMMVNRVAWLSRTDNKVSMHFMTCGGASIDYNEHLTTRSVDGNQPFVLHFSVRGHLHTLFKINHQRIKHDRHNLQQFLAGKTRYPSCPLRFRIAIGDIYSAKQPVTPEIWNVNCDLQYTKCTYDTLERLYGTLTDSNNLSEKVSEGIALLSSRKVPITINSGAKYDITCRNLVK